MQLQALLVFFASIKGFGHAYLYLGDDNYVLESQSHHDGYPDELFAREEKIQLSARDLEEFDLLTGGSGDFYELYARTGKSSEPIYAKKSGAAPHTSYAQGKSQTSGYNAAGGATAGGVPTVFKKPVNVDFKDVKWKRSLSGRARQGRF